MNEVRIPAYAKVNLRLDVLGKRADGFHELRTIFQTISLADTIEIGFTAGRKTSIELDDALGIPDNLVVRAARLAMDAMRAEIVLLAAPRSTSIRSILSGAISMAWR